jgi:hypothetical protein
MKQQRYDLVQLVEEHKITERYSEKFSTDPDKENAIKKAQKLEKRLRYIAVRMQRAMDNGPELFHEALQVALQKVSFNEKHDFCSFALPFYFDRKNKDSSNKNSYKIRMKIAHISDTIAKNNCYKIKSLEKRDPLLYELLEGLEKKAYDLSIQAIANYKANQSLVLTDSSTKPDRDPHRVTESSPAEISVRPLPQVTSSKMSGLFSGPNITKKRVRFAPETNHAPGAVPSS